MTKKPLTVAEIVAQKVSHIHYYASDDLHQALFVGMARDACYTANNSLNFKKKQMADVFADYDRHMAEKDDNAAERAERLIGRLAAELEVLEERLDIEKAVYSEITGGEEWKPAPKKPVARKSNVDIAALRKKLA